jgi:IS1 family transposase
MSKETTRVQMELSEKSLQRLKALKEKTEASSYAEVTKNAYRIYEKMIEYRENDISFCLKDKDGNIKELEMFA